VTIRPRLRAVLLLAPSLLLGGCGPKTAVPDIEPLVTGKVEGFPDPDGGDRLPTPTGPFEGHGRAWTLKIGGSPRDYPGPVPRLPGSDGCEPAVATCSAYQPRECAAAVDGMLAGGLELVRLEVPLSEPGAAHLARSVARRVAEEGDRTHTRMHTLVPGVPTLQGLWASVGDADLIGWNVPLDDAAQGGQLALANQTLRSLGRRAVGRFEGDKWDGDRAAALGLHLATGGVLDGVVPEGAKGEVAWAAAHPELFGRLRARVGLVIPVRALRGDHGEAVATRIAGAARLLDASHFPWDPVIVGDGDRVSDEFNPGRLARTGLVVVVGGDTLHPDTWETLLGATQSPVLVWEEGGDSTLPGAIDPSRVQVRAADGLTALGRGETRRLKELVRDFDETGEDLVDTARRSDGAIDANNLPMGVTVVPSWTPEAGLIVHHLVDAGRISGRPAAGSETGFQIEMHYETAGDLAQCVAQWHLPATGEVHDLPCRTNSLGPSIHVELPAVDEFPPWSVVATRLVIGDRVGALGKIQLDVSGSGEWRSDSVQFQIPFLDEDQIFAITLPEWLEIQHPDGRREHLDPAPWPAELTLDGGRAAGTLVRTGEQVKVTTDIVTTPREIGLTMTLENVGEQPIAEMVALLCATSKGASPFPESGHANTYVWTAGGRERLEDRPADVGEALYPYRTDIVDPIVALESTDGRWVMATAFESSREAGGNGGGDGVCIHSRPRFGPLAPGQKQSRSGRIWIGPAGDLRVPTEWTFEPPDRTDDDGLPWVGGCSEEGRARLAPASAPRPADPPPMAPPPPPTEAEPEPTPS